MLRASTTIPRLRRTTGWLRSIAGGMPEPWPFEVLVFAFSVAVPEVTGAFVAAGVGVVAFNPS